MKSLAGLLGCTMLTISLIAPPEGGRSATAAEDAPAVQPDDRAIALIEKLGDPQFTARRKAANRLIQFGISARRALAEGLKHPDPEIRLSCRRILSVVVRREFLDRLDAFVADEGNGGHDLPGWDRFRELAGSSKPARALFVQMQKAEADLLDLAQRDPEHVLHPLTDRCQQYQEAELAPSASRQTVEVGSVAALLFIAVDEDVAVTNSVGDYLFRFSTRGKFSAAVQGSARSVPLRRLLGAWVYRSGQTPNVIQSLRLAMQYDLKQGVPAAEKLVREEVGATTRRQYAILALAKLGNENHIPILELLLQDATVCYSSRRTKGVTYRTEIRDIALAALLHLAEQDPRQYGYSRVRASRQTVYNVNTLGFNSDAERTAALQKWQAYQARQAPNDPAG